MIVLVNKKHKIRKNFTFKMKCGHGKSFVKCDACVSSTLKNIVKELNTSSCYANAFINFPIESSTIVRTFTQDEIITDGGIQKCISVPLTSVCSTPLLQIGKCRGSTNSWCRIVDQGNGYITSLQVPECCCGCYNFDLSASVALNGILGVSVLDPGLTLTQLSYSANIPCKVSLKLSEQLPREFCVADEVSDTPESCFTSVTFPILDTPMATETLPDSISTSLLDVILTGSLDVLPDIGNTLEPQPVQFSNLSVSGTVCLKSCQRLVPTLTIEPLNLNFVLGNPFQFLGNTITIQSLTNIKLHLASLSLKLKRLGDCKNICNECKVR